MTLSEIKEAIANGKKVYWDNTNYEVIKDSKDQYLIKSMGNNHFIGLTWRDGKTLNGSEKDFFTN